MPNVSITEGFLPYGALIEGLDFAQDDPQMVESIKRALAGHHLLVSRTHEKPSDEQIARFFAQFGQLSSETPEVRAHFARLAKLVPEYVEDGAETIGTRFNLSNVEEGGKKKGGLGNRELKWHNDQADLPRLKTLSCLEALEFEAGAGNTFFCNMYLAAEALPAAMRRQLTSVSALHSSASYRSDSGNSFEAAPSASHPVLLRHPETGRECLYVNPSFTTQIVGLPEDESRGLLDRLFEHAYSDEFVYEHQWREGDLLIWDNVGLQHKRNPLDASKRRTLRVFQGVSETWSFERETADTHAPALASA